MAVGRKLFYKFKPFLMGSAEREMALAMVAQALDRQYTPRGDILALQPVHRCQDVARIRRWSAAEASILYV